MSSENSSLIPVSQKSSQPEVKGKRICGECVEVGRVKIKTNYASSKLAIRFKENDVSIVLTLT